MPRKHKYYPKYKIAVSGSADPDVCSPDRVEVARKIGREIVRQGAVLITGATTGMPYFAAQGAKEEGGMVIGLSPAASERAHRRTYRLPVDCHDVIIYTGFEYAGRNLLMTRAADAVIVVCGRMGTLNEFTIAFEDKKPIGVLDGSGGTTDMIDDIVREAHRGSSNIVYESDPKTLVANVLELIKKQDRK